MATPKLRFKEFDGDWKIKKLGNCFNLISGYAFPSSASVDKGAKWLKIADVGIQEMTPSSLSYLPHEFLEKYPQFIVSKEDYVIALTRPILNKKLKIAKVGSSYDGALLNQRVAKIQTNENDLGFIYSLLQKSKTVEELENSISGTDPPNLSLNDVKDIRLGFPSIEEQTKIATFLSAVDEKISQLTQKHELLSQYKQGMMQKLFSQQIRFKADDGSEFGEWDKVKLGSLLIKHDEKTEFNNQYPVLTSSRHGIYFQKDYFAGQDVASADTTGYNVVPYEYFTYRHMSDDLVFKFNINTICPKGIVSTLYPVFTVKVDQLNKYFLQTILNEGQEFKNFAIMQKQGGSRTYMYFSKLSELFLTLPCLEEQTKIANFLSSIDQKVDVVAQQIEQAKQWKKGLLQQMFV